MKKIILCFAAFIICLLVISCGNDNKKKDVEYSEELVKKAEQGDADAMADLGYVFAEGRGIAKDYEKSAEWTKKAAEQGQKYAQCNMGVDYEFGHGVIQDYDEAAKWYRKSAEQDYSDAQYRLGNCYYFGKGVPKDYAEAVIWYRKAADQGHLDALCTWADCCFNGIGTPKDEVVAVRLIKKALDIDREGKRDDIRYNLGVCYENGFGVSEDINEAIKWYKEAAEKGNQNAIQALHNLGQ